MTDIVTRNAQALAHDQESRAVYCPISRCNAAPGKPCRSRDGLAHEERSERASALHKLRGMLPPGSTVYTVLRHVSRSGMSRRIDVYSIAIDASSGEPHMHYLSGYVATALGYQRHDSGALVVGGCGMDMGYSVVHNLSYALHGMKDMGPDASSAGASGRPFAPTPEQYCSGYSLRHEWI